MSSDDPNQPQVHPTAVIGADVILGPRTRVGPYAVIEDGVVLGADNVVHAQAFIGRFTRMGDGNAVHPGAIVGHAPQDLGFDPKTETYTRIGNGNTFREHCQIHRATKKGEATTIGDKNLFMALSHVAHDCRIGNNCILVNQASLPGHCHLGDRVLMSGFTGIHQFCRIGRLAMVSALSVSNKDLPPFFIYGGRPARAETVNVIGLRRAGVSREVRAEIKQAYRLLYREGLTIPEALDRIERECPSAEAKELVAFCRATKRGIALGTRRALDTRKGRGAASADEGQADDDAADDDGE